MKKLLSVLAIGLLYVNAFSQCGSFSISVDKTDVCAPEILQFILQNSVAGSTYQWDIGNGPQTGSDTFYAVFSSPTSVNVTVDVTLPSGGTCTVSSNGIADVHSNPVPQFLSSQTILCEGPDTISLTDITPNAESRSWVVDGTNYNLSGTTIQHEFVTTGSKKVSLIVVDSNGCQGVSEWLDTIKVYPDLVFDFSTDVDSGCIPQDITYTLTGNPSTPYTKSYQWSFPGSTNPSDITTTPGARTYNSSGEYPASLEVSTSNGCVYTVSKPSSIKLGDVVNLTMSFSNTALCTGSEITANLTTPGLIGTTNWEFIGLQPTAITGDNTTKQLNFVDTGDVNIRLTHNYNGCITTRTFNQVAKVKGLIAKYSSPDNFHCEVPHTVHFYNRTDSMDATSVTYRWNIWDGNTLTYTSTNEDDSFEFTVMDKSYDLELIATGNNGCADTSRLNGFIYQLPLDIAFDVDPKVACRGQEVSIVNGTKPSSWEAPDQFKWTFFDLDGTTVLETKTGFSPTITYSDTGYYDIEATALNGVGCRDTLRENLVVHIVDPTINYTVSDPTRCLGQPFELQGRTEPAEIPFVHTWTFENTSTSDVYTFTGDTAYPDIPVAGEYKLIYEHSIGGGCIGKDSTTVFVDGIDFAIDLDTSQGCAPLSTHPTVNVNYNYEVNDSLPSWTYLWDVTPAGDVVIDDSSISTPEVTFNENGDFNVQLTLQNKAGCSQTVTSPQVLTGVRASFIVLHPSSKVCLGDSVIVRDYSTNGPYDLSWNISPSVEDTFKYIGTNKYSAYIDTGGIYDITVVANRENKCFDTVTRQIEVIDVVADFESIDTFLQCAPVFAQFKSLSQNADSLFWDFGNGNKNVTTDSNSGNIYLKNTGLEDGFDIQLVAKSIFGCQDTAIKEDYVVVQGPRPKFEIEFYQGCDPLEVKFTDLSEDVDRSYFNYNDGTELDSTAFELHTYRNTLPQISSQFFKPILFVYDSLGCAAVYESEHDVEVYKSPSAILDVPYDSGGCVPFSLSFTDSSTFSSSRNWFLNGTLVSSQTDYTRIFDVDGDFDLEMVASNVLGCYDTAVVPIAAHETPVVNFNILDTVCLYKVVNFEGVVAKKDNDYTYLWDFGDSTSIGNPVTFTLNSNFTYNTVGIKRISLAATSSQNCVDSVVKMVEVRGPSDIDQPRINVVTFIDNYTLEIDHEASTYDRFKEYTYNRSDNSTFTEEDRLTTVLEDVFTVKPATALCYDLSVQDICDLQGASSTEHCFIHLNVVSTVDFQNDLTWSPYIGWGGVSEYRIFRKKGLNTVYDQLATVPGTTTMYTDIDLCDEDYTYYVMAIHPTDPTISSNSFSMLSRPLYRRNIVPSHIKNVTVTDDQTIEVTWNKSAYDRWRNYKVLKYAEDLTSPIATFDASDTVLIDDAVDITNNSYTYFVQEEDQCGYQNTTGREGKSIVLDGHYADYSNLYWTSYKNWENGVKKYNVEIYKNGQPEFLHTNDWHDHDWIDESVHSDIPGELCYRVYGLNELGDTSYSNSVCMSGLPKLDLPTGFSPNKDGLNDVFRPIVQFMDNGIVRGDENFNFSIFNRWGEKIFNSEDLLVGWDGTYKGKECNQGVYIYSIRAQGINKQKVYHQGVITLLR